MTLNLALVLREAARSFPGKPALLLDSGRVTYAQLDAASDRLAAGLRARGLAPGDRVALQLPNVPQFVIAYFGILKAGGVVVPVNVLFKAGEVGFVLGDSGARTLITWAGSAEEAAKGAADAGVHELFVLDLPGFPPATAGRPFDQLLATPVEGRPPMHQGDPGDTAVIVYTAGTTGRPKGAELTHFQLFMNADTPGRLFGIRDDDVVLVVLPLFHVFGLSSILDVCVRFGATMSLVTRFEPAKALEVMQRDRVTIFEGVPTMYVALLQHPGREAYDLSALRVGVSGGAPLPAEVIDEFEREFGVVILEGYGLSETASTTTFNVSAEERRVYSVGKPIYGVEVEVRDAQDRPLPPGREHVGEIVVRGVNVMKGYHGHPEATAQAMAGGWFHTGDLGYVDEDGFFFVVDRKKDLIIRGGYNVYPREVEDVLYGHPAVAAAAVVGVPDERLGQEVKAFVALRPGRRATEEELVGWARERLASYKYPRSVEFRDQLPVNATGKILKRELTP
ncbi:long-chain fatty acid--CoA ligase [Blastococcus sp. MG754426]|uniref:long-chain-fatty-acid--CoA ligase n=1 Tax=unclassified Blastococcus TaxID=2619396 RepID=UPI001EEF8CC5|nr:MULTISPECIES: long-chain fatty acid--CoA ligase [unclassified Blastococcus]MCF6508568.1 long-chain fatty acid--CoA ligase [Blastococcus sp. MG754426]MCF6510759.1 long-chain fatty acid--CoA ligase [Blastococcus sp. MG754427]MCF6734323.1 long-chain fatty acid--CoA ligase [Blastococcus sp. KM273129]